MDMDQGIRNISICVYMSKPRCRFVSKKRPRPQAPKNSASSLSVNDVEPNAAPWFAEVAVYGMAWLGARLGDVCLCVYLRSGAMGLSFWFPSHQMSGRPSKTADPKAMGQWEALNKVAFHLPFLPSLSSVPERKGRDRREGWMIRQLLSRMMEYLARRRTSSFSDRHTNTGIG